MDKRVVALGVVVLLAVTAGCLGLGSTDGTATDDVTNESSTDELTGTEGTADNGGSADNTGEEDEQLSNGTDSVSEPPAPENGTAREAEKEEEDEQYAYGDPVEESEEFETQVPVDPPELERLEVDMFEVGTAQPDQSDDGCALNRVQMLVNNTFEEPTIVTFNFTIERAGGPDVHGTGERHFRPNEQFNLVRLFRPYTLLGPDWCTSYEEDGPTIEALYVSVEEVEKGTENHGYVSYGTWAADVFDMEIYDEVFHKELEWWDNIALSSLTIGNETILPETEMPRDPLID